MDLRTMMIALSQPTPSPSDERVQFVYYSVLVDDRFLYAFVFFTNWSASSSLYLSDSQGTRASFPSLLRWIPQPKFLTSANFLML